MAMTGDDVTKGVFGFIMALMGGAITWLISSVLQLREGGIAHELKHKRLEEKVMALEDDKVTRECIREEIETALEKRDKQAEQRNAERAELRKFEMRTIIGDAIESAIPRIVHQVKGNTGVVKRPRLPGDDE